MAWTLHIRGRDYLVLDCTESDGMPGVYQFPDIDCARCFLRESLDDYFGMSELRHVAAECNHGAGLVDPCHNDCQVIESIAWDLVSGRLRIVEELPAGDSE